MFGCEMMDLQNVLTMCHEKGRFNPHTSLRPKKNVSRAQAEHWDRQIPLYLGRFGFGQACKLQQETYSQPGQRESICHPGRWCDLRVSHVVANLKKMFRFFIFTSWVIMLNKNIGNWITKLAALNKLLA